MKRLIAFSAAALIAAPAFAEPHYADKAVRKTVEKMVAAHGGFERWISAPSIELDLAMVLLVLPEAEGRTPKDDWRYYLVTVEPKSSKAIVDVPWEDAEGPEVGLTRDAYWRRNLTFDPAFQDPPHMLGWYHYGMISLPFLSQVDGVHIESAEGMTHPYSGADLIGVKMTFEPGGGKTHAGEAVLYIDPETNLVAAWRTSTMFPLLPGDVLPAQAPRGPGGALRVVESYADADGLVLPRAYASIGPDGAVNGTHVVLSARIGGAFPHDAALPPADAEIIYQRPE